MPYIPHTPDEVRSMLDTIGAESIEALFDEIPAHLKADKLDKLPEGRPEMEVLAQMGERAARDGQPLCFLGAGAYDHHVPAAVWELATRGEFYTAYTPYQAEASQGTLQTIYEFQTMMSRLTGMEVSNASVYDGASGLAEAVLMALRANRKSKSRRVLVPDAVNPRYRAAVESITSNQGVEQELVPFCTEAGQTLTDSLKPYEGDDYAALVVPQPNFFGSIEEVDALTNWAHEQNMLVIALVNPTALALLTPPGEWGQQGADIVVGEGQPLGCPISSGGPYFGFMCCTRKLVRQMPGRIIAKAEDTEGRTGYTMTLQAREQHIRRSKATSNICTNQGLAMTAATIHMALLGPEGLTNTAAQSHSKLNQLLDKLTAIDGVEKAFTAPGFHEAVIRLPKPAQAVVDALSEQNILAGYPLSQSYHGQDDQLLICATEKRTEDEMDRFANALQEVLQ